MKVLAIKSLAFAATVAAFTVPLQAQRAIQLEPFPATSFSSVSEVHVQRVENHYGKCGPATVQVLGVERQVEDFFTNSGSTRVVVIGEGRETIVTLEEELSDHVGVACVGEGAQKFLLVWSNCAGTACGDEFTFTVVDAAGPRVLARSPDCDTGCAEALTGSNLPTRLNAWE